MKENIIRSEERLRLAMESSNIDELEELIDDDLIFTTHFGQVLSKSEDLAIHRSGDLKFKSVTLSDPRILFQGETAIVSVTADICATFKSENADGVFKFTRVWANAHGSYKVVAGHACRAM